MLDAAAKEAAEGQAGQPRGVQRHHQGGDHRGHEASARHRRAAGRRLSPPGARSTISSASRCRRSCGASCRARARRDACSRWRSGSSATASPEIERFKPQEYWSVGARLNEKGKSFEARLHSVDGKVTDKLDVKTGEDAEALKRAIEAGRFRVASVEKKPTRRNPYPPFTTSSLQQDASSRLGFSPARTMQLAQRLYEDGVITYMRTDGIDMAPEAIAQARRAIEKEYGTVYLPPTPRIYQNKAKNAQEAHEAIRPTTCSERPTALAIPAQALRADLAAHPREPDAAGRDRADHRRHRGRGVGTGHRAARGGVGRHVRGVPRRLRRRGEGGPAAERRRGGRGQPRAAAARRGRHATARGGADRAALHPAAAALHRSEPHQEDGGARHRPAVDLRGDHVGAAGPQLRAAREAGADPRGSRPAGRRVPRELLQAIRRIRLHRASRRAARPDLGGRAALEGRAARLLGRVHPAHRGDQGPPRLRRAGRAQRAARRAHLPAQAGRLRSAPLPHLRHRHAVAQARQVRRLHRLLELS